MKTLIRVLLLLLVASAGWAFEVRGLPANPKLNSLGVGTAATGVAGQLAVNSSLIVNGGAAITRHLSATALLDFGPTAANTCDNLTIAVTGASDGDTVVIGTPNALASGANTSVTGFVSAAGIVTVRRCNVAALVAADPLAATVRADVWQH